MPDEELPPCIGEGMRDTLTDIYFAAYEAAWERAYPSFEEPTHEQEDPRQG